MTHKLRASCIAALVLIVVSGAADAAVTWEGEASQFRYAVDKNGGMFTHPPSFYFKFQ